MKTKRIPEEVEANYDKFQMSFSVRELAILPKPSPLLILSAATDRVCHGRSFAKPV